jgi:hypothetical protein
MIDVIKLKKSICEPYDTFKRLDDGSLIIAGITMPSTKDILEWNPKAKITGNVFSDTEGYYQDESNYKYFDIDKKVSYKRHELNIVG